MIGRTITHYKIVEELGRGGMGVVYKAEDIKLGRPVALKFLPTEFTRDAEAKKRFALEAHAAATLNHPNICTIYEIDEEEGRSFIAMELVEGESLTDRIAAGPLDLGTAVDITMQAAAALSVAHGKNIVHRDIKPANIMIASGGVVKIMDFGMARIGAGSQLTKEGTTLGTVAYMPPEQARGREVDHRADIWSLGVVLYEMVSGRRPFKGEYDQAMIYSIINDESDPLTSVRTGVPKELERIVSKCLLKDREERYQTAADLIADLRHLEREMRDQPASPAQATAGPEPAAGRKDRRRIPVLWVLLILVIAAGAFTVPKLLSRRSGPPAGTAPPELAMIVVLPFENLGPSDDEYFADGITDAITARLAALSGLGVISRQSAIQYKGSSKTTHEIAGELGVGYILEGTIQREKPGDPHSRVRIIPQLIRASDDIHIWAGTFDEQMTEVFKVQSEIAEQVAEALDVKLLGRELTSLQSRPTENIEAYEYYLQALEYNDRRMNPDHALKVIELLEKTVETDPDFAVAWAMLSEAYIWAQWMDLERDNIGKAQAAAERAMEIDPDLPEAQRALGYIQYYGLREYEKALSHFEAALEMKPNDVDVLQAIGLIMRRLGRWEEAIGYFEKVYTIDPRNFQNNGDGLGNTLFSMRRYDEALRFIDLAIAMKPDVAVPYFVKIQILLNRSGDTDGAREVLGTMFEKASPEDICFMFSYMEFGPLVRICFESPCDYLEQYKKTLCKSKDLIDWACFYTFQYLCASDEAAKQKALLYADSTRAELDSGSSADDFVIALYRIFLGQVYAYMGRSEDALRECRLVQETFPPSRDAVAGPELVLAQAEIFTLTGHHEAAIDKLDLLLSTQSGFTMRFFMLDPLFDPLHDYPGFKELERRYSDQ